MSSSEKYSNQKWSSRYYVVKSTPFFVEENRYYEVTLQLADINASKYNRITAYTKLNIQSSYSIRIQYYNSEISLWDILTNIMIITRWEVSIFPICLNKLAKITCFELKMSAKMQEYASFMNYLTTSKLNILEIIDSDDDIFDDLISHIYANTNTKYFENVLIYLHKYFYKGSHAVGTNVIRYLLLNLREETLTNVFPYDDNTLSSNLVKLSKKCYAFDQNPFISNLTGTKTNEISQIYHTSIAVGKDKMEKVMPYLIVKSMINKTGEIYFDENSSVSSEEIKKYNSRLSAWDIKQGYDINDTDGVISIRSYEITTLDILKKLIVMSKKQNKGQKEYNASFIKKFTHSSDEIDEVKKKALLNAFSDSHLLLIYGAAGTGKTTLLNYISNLMRDKSKLFLTKTHTALQNLRRRIENPGEKFDFISIDSYNKRVNLSHYDLIIVDECSTIDNRTMQKLLSKVNEDTLLVLAGDIYQIESIEFGNWFYYAKNIIVSSNSNVELFNTWRTQDESLIGLWDEVRRKGNLVTEKLAMDGKFSESIGKQMFKKSEDDEIILCLNYDGKFGLNNMNHYLQDANPQGNSVIWNEWKFKAGDRILFNESRRFPHLYNNLKGKIIDISESDKQIKFTIDVATIITEMDCKAEGIDFVDIFGENTRISISILKTTDENDGDFDEYSIIPFQLAYAVSIHKAQGLEYDSVKVVIPSNNMEKITHGIFYTAITRAKKKLKIYWSAETMNKIVDDFQSDNKTINSLEIVKMKLKDKNLI